MRTYNELTLEERVEMQQRLASGESLRAIGRSLINGGMGWLVVIAVYPLSTTESAFFTFSDEYASGTSQR